MADAPRIVRTRDTLHGKPRIEGTRWPTEIVPAFGFDLATIHAQYPHLTIAQIMAAYHYERRWYRRLRRWAYRTAGRVLHTIGDE